MQPLLNWCMCSPCYWLFICFQCTRARLVKRIPVTRGFCWPNNLSSWTLPPDRSSVSCWLLGGQHSWYMALSLHKAFVHSGPPARIRLIMGTASGCQTGSVQARLKGSSSETDAHRLLTLKHWRAGEPSSGWKLASGFGLGGRRHRLGVRLKLTPEHLHVSMYPPGR